jgi:hypothetical protein
LIIRNTEGVVGCFDYSDPAALKGEQAMVAGRWSLLLGVKRGSMGDGRST